MMVPNNESSEHKKSIIEEIEEEKRRIRILEADLECTKSRKRSPPFNNCEDDDWLSALDFLHSEESSRDINVKLDHRWHDDPLLYRTLPYVSGIAFESANPADGSVAENSDGLSCTRSFQFRGYVCALQATNISFEVMMTVFFSYRENEAKIIMAKINFSNSSDEEELQNIALVTSETCSLPFAFRQLVEWAKFDWRRRNFILLYCSTYARSVHHIKRSTIRIMLSEEQNDWVDVCWRWNIQWDSTIGNETLTIIPHVPSTKSVSSTILQAGELEKLVEICDGSCQSALSKILEAILHIIFPKDNH